MTRRGEEIRLHRDRAQRERSMATRAPHPLARLAHENLAAMHDRFAAEVSHEVERQARG